MKKPLIKATLIVLGRKNTAQGKSVREVLMKLKPVVAKGRGVLVLERGKQKRERILSRVVVNGVFGATTPTLKEIRLRGIENMFSDFK